MSFDIGIDLGTSTVIGYTKQRGILFIEPSIVAVNRFDEDYFIVGTEAYKMIEKTPDHIELIRPIKEGVISNFGITLRLLKYYIKKINKNKIFEPRVMMCVPSKVTEVERRAVIDAAMQAGAGKVYLIEQPVAAAIGAGIDITKPSGNIVVDIGSGLTDIAVIANKGTVLSSTINIASNSFDEIIINYIKRKYKVLIGVRTAENIKIEIGSAIPLEQSLNKIVTGRDLLTGLPKMIEIKTFEIMEILRPKLLEIVEEIKVVIEKTPPEMLEGIKTKGIYLVGGGSMLYGINEFIENYISIKTTIAKDPVTCAGIGAGKALEELNNINSSKWRK